METKSLKMGWIGTGVMGASMCGHLLRAGYRVTVYNRTKKKAEGLFSAGAAWADGPEQVAENSDIVFTIVSYPADVEAVILGEGGVQAGLRRGGIVVDMTTSSPELAKRIYERSKEKGVEALDAPVSGGDVGAREARLSIMAGGEREVFEKVRPLFELMGKNINYMGPAGAGQHTKMANQIHIATTMIGAVESLLYAQRAGLDLTEVIGAIGSGAAGSWTINNLGPRIVKRDFAPGFFIEHFIKDLGIALAEARRMNLCLPGLAMAEQFYLAARAMGYGKNGTQALALVLEKLNAMDATP